MTTPDNEQQTIEAIASHFKQIIRLLGDDPEREGLLKTPIRAAKALYRCTEGYRQSADEVVGDALFHHHGSGMVTVRDIEFYSFCEHHILPFFGNISIGYLPTDKIIGISKLARMVNHYARRLQVQERLTAEVCRTVAAIPGCRGAIVVCRAQHLCMKMRGVEKQDASTVTIETCGEFDNPEMQRRFFDSIR